MIKIPSGQVLVWGGGALALSAFAWFVLGGRGHQATSGVGLGGWGRVLSVAPIAMLYLGLAVVLAGIFKRAGEASQRLAARNFSWCIKCGYPFDERAGDTAMLTCSECGTNVRAGEAREWNRIHPERLRRSDS